MSETDHDPSAVVDLLPPGTRVEVRSRFDGSWTKGFEVSGLDGRTYQVRRLSDGSELPQGFDRDDVRRERKRETWWI